MVARLRAAVRACRGGQAHLRPPAEAKRLLVGSGGPCRGAAGLSTPPRPEYPRPNLRRQDWVNLNGEWLFAFGAPGDESSGPLPVERFDRRITVPFCYQS